jgi:taurine dioxygenase
MTTHWTIAPLTGHFGAEITGVDLCTIEDSGAAELGRLLGEHAVLVMRGQQLDPGAQVSLARKLGEPTPAHPVVPGLDGHPEVLLLDGAVGGRNARWHTDVTFVAAPPAASILTADVLPATGGDTLWADLRLAHDTLAPPLRALVHDLEAVHRITPLAYWGEPFDTALGRDDAHDLLTRSLSVPPVVHPVVRIHPGSARPALFVNPGFTSHVIGLSRIESDHLLAMLYEHSTRPEVTLRHRWQVGDVVMWDNQATMHYAVDDYGSTKRVMRRVTLRGTEPFGPTGNASRVVDDPLLAIR